MTWLLLLRKSKAQQYLRFYEFSLPNEAKQRWQHPQCIAVFLILMSYAWPETTTVISFLQALWLINHVGTKTALMRKNGQIKQKLLDLPASSHPTGACAESYKVLFSSCPHGRGWQLFRCLYLGHVASCPVLLQWAVAQQYKSGAGGTKGGSGSWELVSWKVSAIVGAWKSLYWEDPTRGRIRRSWSSAPRQHQWQPAAREVAKV